MTLEANCNDENSVLLTQMLHHINSPKRNKSKLLLSCRGGKPFNLQNKLSESEIKLDILTHFSPLVSYHLSYTNEKCDPRPIYQSKQCYYWAFTTFLSHVSVHSHFLAFVVYRILQPLWSIFLSSVEKMISKEIAYLAQLTNRKSAETNRIEVLKWTAVTQTGT